LFKTIFFSVSLLENETLVENKYIELSGGGDFANRDNDDQYIINFVLTKLGLTPAQIASMKVSTQ
jgi:hypothetical protein